MHGYAWFLVGRLTLALSPHRRLHDRPTTAMRSGPTWETCLRRTCRFPFFLLGFRSRPTSLPLRFSGGPNPRWARTAPWASFFFFSLHVYRYHRALFIRASDTVGSNPTCRAREALEGGVAWLVVRPVHVPARPSPNLARATTCRAFVIVYTVQYDQCKPTRRNVV